MRLTDTQERVLVFIARDTARVGYPPTLKEIARSLGASSAYAAHCHLSALEAKGMIRRVPRASRAIAITPAGRERVLAVAEREQCG